MCDFLSDSRRAITDQEMMMIADHLGSSWRSFGRQVGLPNSDLDVIKHDFNTDGLREICYQMLRRWKERTGRACTIGALARALCAIQMSEVAAKLTE